MSKKNKSKSSPNTSQSSIQIMVAKLGLLGTILTTIITTAGVIIASYFGVISIQSQISIPIYATQTAEAKVLPTSPPSLSFIPSPTPVTEPTLTITPTLNLEANTIAITEVMANPCGPTTGRGETYWNEYIELYNYGNTPIDVGGWWVTDGEDIKGNPDRLISWNARYPGQKFGSNIGLLTDITIIDPDQYALILSPQYLKSESYSKPYLIPSGTVILTIDDDLYLGDEGGGLEVSTTLNIVVLYKGTDDYIDLPISTYGSPSLSASPKNIKDDPIKRDRIPLVLNDCFSAERQEAAGPDAEYNWEAVENGTPGSGPYNP